MELEISDTGVPWGVTEIANKLPDPTTVKQNTEIIITFSSDEFVYLTGLVLLATWRKALPPGVIVKLNDVGCPLPNQRFLTNTGFREIIETGHETPSVQNRIGRVPLRPITNKFVKEATVNEIVSIFDEYAGQVPDTNPFRVLISEMCENVLAHSEFVCPGYVCARAMERIYKAEIAIADSGIGILNSYLRGTNDQVKEKIRRGASPLELAIEGLNSSKPKPTPGQLRSYYGFGLLVARRLVEENRGQLFLVSGDEALHIDRYSRRLTKLVSPWKGTFIALVLDLANPLPLEEIYDTETAKYVTPSPIRKETKASSPTTMQGQPQPTLDIAKADQVPVSESIVIEVVKPTAEMDASVVPAMPSKTIELQHYGTELLTREAGTAIRADIAAYLAAGYSIRAVLDGVSDITPSVADEAFAKLAEIIGHDAFQDRVELVGGSSLARRLIAFVLQTRRSRSGSG